MNIEDFANAINNARRGEVVSAPLEDLLRSPRPADQSEEKQDGSA